MVNNLLQRINSNHNISKFLVFDQIIRRDLLAKFISKNLKKDFQFNFFNKLKTLNNKLDFSNEETLNSNKDNTFDFLIEIINYLKANKSKINLDYLTDKRIIFTNKKINRNAKIKKICFSTGKRGGFGAINPLLKLSKNDKDIELQLICTDMHLYDSFEKTMNEVSKYFQVSKVVDMAQMNDSRMDRTRSLGRCITGMAEALTDLDPDIVLILGDRGETLATAFASVELGIPVAHIQAGDVSGGLDDIHRHAITKLSHLHFFSD